jgi:hypothetical protein
LTGRTGRIALQWPRFGPYHLARLSAAARLFATRGIETFGLETATTDAIYGWRVEVGSEGFTRRTLFPGRCVETVDPAEVREAMFRALDEIDPGVVAVCGYVDEEAWTCLRWCRARRRGAVLMTDSKEDDAPRRIWRERFKSRVVRSFDAALCGGTPHLQYLEKLGLEPQRVRFSTNCVDNAYFRRAAEVARAAPLAADLPGLREAGAFFLASARFVKRKNLERLLLAYEAYRARVADGTAPWRLVILGDGEERLRLEGLIRSRAIRGVTLAGFRQIDELPSYYARAGAFVHPALQEQWGLVVNEAIASGLPVIVSKRCGCATDLVRHGETGLLFDPESVDALAALMLEVSGDEGLRRRLAEGGSARIDGWDLDHFVSGLGEACALAEAHAAERRGGPIGLPILDGVRRLARALR